MFFGSGKRVSDLTAIYMDNLVDLFTRSINVNDVERIIDDNNGKIKSHRTYKNDESIIASTEAEKTAYAEKIAKTPDKIIKKNAERDCVRKKRALAQKISESEKQIKTLTGYFNDVSNNFKCALPIDDEYKMFIEDHIKREISSVTTTKTTSEEKLRSAVPETVEEWRERQIREFNNSVDINVRHELKNNKDERYYENVINIRDYLKSRVFRK